jgi:hypothetical protein
MDIPDRLERYEADIAIERVALLTSDTVSLPHFDLSSKRGDRRRRRACPRGRRREGSRRRQAPVSWLVRNNLAGWRGSGQEDRLSGVRGKHVTFWPDNDDAGWKYFLEGTGALQGGWSCRCILG